jgi:hypothetical protein
MQGFVAHDGKGRQWKSGDEREESTFYARTPKHSTSSLVQMKKVNWGRRYHPELLISSPLPTWSLQVSPIPEPVCLSVTWGLLSPPQSPSLAPSLQDSWCVQKQVPTCGKGRGLLGGGVRQELGELSINHIN